MGASEQDQVDLDFLIGPVARRGGSSVQLSLTEWAILGSLAVDAGGRASTLRLVESVWGEHPPTTARKSLQNQVVRLRRKLGDTVLRTMGAGYELDLGGGSSDLDAFERAAAIALDRDRTVAERIDATKRALALWNGPRAAIADRVPQLAPRLASIVERRRALEEIHVELLLRTGSNAEAVEHAEQFVQREPYREARWWLLMLALARAGRRRDAINTFGRARRLLVSELGIEPGPTLRALETAILADDPRVADDRILRAIAPATPRAVPQRDVFVGRSGELGALAAALTQASGAGGPVLVDVVGEPGIGKTTLVDEFTRRTDVLALVGGCDPVGTQPLEPFVAALGELAHKRPNDVRRVAGIDPAALGWLVPALAAPLGNAAPDNEMTRDRVDAAVVGTLAALAETQPTVLVVEDVHWAGPATSRLLGRVLASSMTSLLVVATRRASETPDPAVLELIENAERTSRCVRVDLGGLDRTDLAEYLSAALETLDDVSEVADWLAGRTSGHPLFVRELTHHLAATGAISSERGAWSVEADEADLPDTVRHAISQRIDALGADTVATLQIVALAGPACRVDVLERVAGSVTRALDEAQRSLLLWFPSPKSVAFTHDLVRRYLAELIPEGRRIELHERLGELIEADPDADEQRADIARHFVEAVSLDRPRAVEACRRAGDAALARFDYDAAVHWYERGLEFLAQSGRTESIDECEFAISRGEAMRRAGMAENVRVLVDAADLADRLGDPDRMARAALSLCQLGYTSEAGGLDTRAADVTTRALESVQDLGLRARLSAAATVFYSLTDDGERGHLLFDRAEATAREQGDPATLAAVLATGYLGCGRPTDFPRREAIANELIDLSQTLGDVVAEFEGLHMRFSIELVNARLAGMHDCQRRMRELADLLHEPTRLWITAYQDATLAQLAGDLDTAEEHLWKCNEYGQLVNPSRNLAVVGSQLLGIRDDQGRAAELLPIIDDAVTRQGLMPWVCARALAASQAGDTDPVRADAERITADDFAGLATDFVWLGAMVVCARATATLRDPELARRVYDRLVPYRGLLSWQGTTTYGPVDFGLGALALAFDDDRLVLRHLRDALEVAAAVGSPIMRARCRLGLAAIPTDDAEVAAILDEARGRGWGGVLADAAYLWRVAPRLGNEPVTAG